MKALVMLSALLFGLATASARAAEEVSPDIFQVNVNVTFAPGSYYATAPVVTTPANKRLVIQSVSFYRGIGSSGSSASIYLATTIFGAVSFWAVPEVYSYATGVPFPGTTMSSTIYAGAGSQVYINAYRNGDLTSGEPLSVAISGYYVAKP